jgi:hypothetical protein
MLIDIKKIAKEKELYMAKSHEDKCHRYINEDVRLEIDVQMGALEMGKSIHYATAARWHLHDVLVWALGKTGKADLYFCTYAIKETQARLISNMHNDGLIGAVSALIDYRVSVHDANVVQLLQGFAEVGKMRTHAKLIVLRNDEWGVTVAGSANLTQNTSADIGVITCDMGVADYRIDWIKQNIKNGI